jgi:site-specific recombinase XerD
MNTSDWIDHWASPPRLLPGDIGDAIDYLSACIGSPVYLRWTPATLMARHGDMPRAKAALPDVFSQLLEAECVIQFWHQGETVALPLEEAPRPEIVITRLLRAMQARFRPATPRPTATTIKGEVLRDCVRRGQPKSAVEDERWLKGHGRFWNPDCPSNTLGLDDDALAVKIFMADCANLSTHTRRAYMSAIRRLIKWCESRGLGPLSDLTRDNLIAYKAALADMAAQTSSTGHNLSRRSQSHALSVIRSLYGYLLRTGYLLSNPAAELGDTAASRTRFSPARVLPPEAVRACDAWLKVRLGKMEHSPDVLRRAAIVAIYRYTGVRLDELAWREAFPRLRTDPTGWTLTVMGKGQKERSIPLPDVCVAFISQYRLSSGLSATPAHDELLPLILGRRNGALGAKGLYREVKIAFDEMARSVPSSDPSTRLALRRASPHWLRHLVGKTLVVDNKIPLPVAQALLGHASVATTAAYARADLSELRTVMQQSFRLED